MTYMVLQDTADSIHEIHISTILDTNCDKYGSLFYKTKKEKKSRNKQYLSLPFAISGNSTPIKSRKTWFTVWDNMI